MTELPSLLEEVRACTLCESELPLGVRPVLQVSSTAKILIAGQAPGRKVHESGIPFDDASGKRLREWMDVSEEQFYDASQIAILPMGFCFPGTGKSGDLAPRPECAPAWRGQLLSHLNQVGLTIVLGSYAQKAYFGGGYSSVTELVKSWESQLPNAIPLPHPSPRNNIWLRKNEWFETDVVPALRQRTTDLLTL